MAYNSSYEKLQKRVRNLENELANQMKQYPCSDEVSFITGICYQIDRLFLTLNT